MASGQLTNAMRHIRRMLGAPDGGDLSDRQLLERFAASRDEDAFGTLVERHGPVVFGVCRRILANPADVDDAFQATFLVLARKARLIQWHDSIGNWLYGVAYRTANKLKSKDALRRRHEQEAGTMLPNETVPKVDCHELSRIMDDELMGLPTKYRLPLLLC